MIHFEGLRKKIIKNYFIIIIITVTLFEGLFIFYAQNYYYDSIKTTLTNQARNTDSIYSGYMGDSSFEQKVNNLYDKKDIDSYSKMALEIIDKDKNIIIDQYGFRSREKAHYDDVNEALKTNNNKHI